ncbi:hypothetical protein [Agromyces kandeliae]|uniref:Secreted protein n=1 Tax=Agromyces kandeliae TaxID=2666141 RepID=A0A6L5QWT3_9MICO|nr:hypothetical protein [Agromyces kandeliae]MRX42149.1 hypothetical protein [Agromyces kandeliae]
MRARARTTALAALAAAAGLALAVTTAVAPASAAKPVRGGTTTTSVASGCGDLNGLKVTAKTVSRTIALNAGDVIGVTVSPARSGDMIILSGSAGLSIIFEEASATTGMKYTAPYSTTYGLGWSLETSGTIPSDLTWTFTCSGSGGSSGGGATISDADRDGVADSADSCPSTSLPDSVSRPTAGKYFANSSGKFVDGTGASAGVTVVDAGGCSATQIAKALRLSKKDSRSGISLTTLKNWAATH